jgi:hypothetical protein
MIWFGVVIAMNLQTSFLTPPFGFALFYLRSVAAKSDYKDRVTGATIPAVTTAQIYKGSIAYIILQLIMVAAVIAFPGLVTGGIEKGETVDADKILQQMQDTQQKDEAAASAAPAAGASQPDAASSEAAGDNEPPLADDDPMKALQDAMKDDAKKK